jgi:hypothetical protein
MWTCPDHFLKVYSIGGRVRVDRRWIARHRRLGRLARLDLRRIGAERYLP